MKWMYKILVAFGVTGFIFSGCSDDESLSATEKQLDKLSGTWVISEATMSSTDYTDEYADFELTLSGSAGTSVYAYGVVGRPVSSPWPAGGTWSFGSDIKTDIVRDPGTSDELEVTYAVSGSQLIITFLYAGDGYNARVGSVSGNWTYTFERK
jgi:hypothetical protein